jgi:N-acetyl-gamma-glutamylphosphate reductase
METNLNFFIVGAMRTGTTYLTTLLDEHPEIEMIKPFSPEPKSFVVNRNYTESDKIEYINKNFSPHIQIRGEKTVFYCEAEHSAKAIQSLFPDAIIIFLVRHPLFRAVSNYFFNENSLSLHLSICFSHFNPYSRTL